MIKHIFLLICVLTSISPASAEESCIDDELCVDNPFRSDRAINDFLKCYPEYKDKPEIIKAMRKINRIKYSWKDAGFCPVETYCRPGVKYFKGTRLTRVDAPYLSTATASGIANSFQQDGCSFSRVSGFNHSVDRKEVKAGFSWRHQKRACDKHFGKHNICSSSAKIEYKGTFTPDFSLSENLRIYDEDTKCFGLSVDALSVAFAAVGAGAFGAVGMLAGVLVADEISGAEAFGTNSFLGEGVKLDLASKISNSVGRADQYIMKYQRSYTDSGFIKQDDAGSLEYVEHGFLDDDFQIDYLRERKMEIKFLKELSAIGRPKYIIKRGDTLWQIARDNFGVAELYLVIEGINGVRGHELKVGQEIEIPLHHEVCESVRYSADVVRKGDTLTGKADKGEIPHESIRAIIPRSGNIDLIYPFEILKVRQN